MQLELCKLFLGLDVHYYRHISIHSSSYPSWSPCYELEVIVIYFVRRGLTLVDIMISRNDMPFRRTMDEARKADIAKFSMTGEYMRSYTGSMTYCRFSCDVFYQILLLKKRCSYIRDRLSPLEAPAAPFQAVAVEQ